MAPSIPMPVPILRLIWPNAPATAMLHAPMPLNPATPGLVPYRLLVATAIARSRSQDVAQLLIPALLIKQAFGVKPFKELA